MRAAWTLGSIYVGSVIGAGFSSGQELMRFFVAFGPRGLWGIAVAAGGFFLVGAVILERVYALRTSSHQDLLIRLCGPSLGAIADTMLSVVLFGTMGVLLSAAGALLHSVFGLPTLVGVILTAFLTRAIVRRDAAKLLDLNKQLVGLLLLLTIGCLSAVLWRYPLHLQMPNELHVTDTGLIPENWFLGSVLYVSFNAALSLSPLGALGSRITGRLTAFGGALFASTCLGLTALVIVLTLRAHWPAVAGEELPVLSVIRWTLPALGPVYTAALMLAILTSCVSGAYGLGERYGRLGAPAHQTAGWVPLLAVPVGLVGFSNLVQTLYPVVGYVGLGIVFMALFHRLRYRDSVPPLRLRP